jgi:glycosyltransferase involved in cell wall biosynthesis
VKLIIQIPCYNEEETLAITLKDLPKEVEGFDSVEWLIIDDGSTDRTIEVALGNGVNHIVRIIKNQGLARAFMAGIDACIKLGADVIVNTDADNQYNGEDIPLLTGPILNREADIVIGTRPINEINHFSPLKKILQKGGSFFVRLISRTDIEDAPSGFRAFSRNSAMKLNVFNNYTYTMETIIQGKIKNMVMVSVPVRVNTYRRPSKLIKSIPSYIRKSILVIIRIYITYKPFAFFLSIAVFLLIIGLVFGLKFLYLHMYNKGTDGITSLIVSTVFLAMGFNTALIAFIADLLAVNRRILEDLQYRIRKMESNDKVKSEK